MIETIDDLKAALNEDDLRRMSGEKVLNLVKMVQNDEVSKAVLPALSSVAPDIMVKLAQAMDESTQKAIASNDQSSGNISEQIAMSKRILIQIIEDPNSSDETRKDALDRLERYDDKLLEHDRDNKRFILEALRMNKETILTVVTTVATISLAAIFPDSRKWLVQNGGKLASDVTRAALPGK